ncbi:chemotaxis protein CheW [Alkalilimnicola ehrlichii MLHE-1]|uniref:CheW protein n=1 Tax=Alkalilimnicola ehrlichii (strain ATCC BAA-1101 / DSM 17681 / MLHE-1) TaxID=187272 RepID=Q0A9Z3_ALKEH|nr:chemotaxis protein CheW [Alkalilimnicola ehrlichii]ABI56344.1 CheW protein [Alkalilimnicola ehrlichii MLHE-1]
MAERRDKTDPELVRQDRAVSSYLEDLLAAIPEGDGETEAGQASGGGETPPAVRPAAEPAAARPAEKGGRPVRESPAPPVIHLPELSPTLPAPEEIPARHTREVVRKAPRVEAAPEPAAKPARTSAPAPEVPEVPELPETPVPDWASPDFQALIFHVGGLRLAVPLIKLQSVVPFPERVTRAPGKPPWYRGLFHYRGRNVKVVDTATLVLDRHRDRLEEADRRPRKLLVVGEGEWALACREVGEVMRLRPDQVQWRTRRGRRRWLAGTVREHLCALMDTDAFAELLNQGEA